MPRWCYVLVRQADVGSVEVLDVYADVEQADRARDARAANDGDAYTSWVEEHLMIEGGTS